MTKIIYTVYKTTNTINNKIYIGVHKTTNPNDSYLGSGIIIKSAIQKYGKSNFTKSILFDYDNSNDAYLKESQIVNSKFIKSKNTYNISIGGNGGNTGNYKSGKFNPNYGSKRTLSTRIQMSKSAKIKLFTKEHRNNMSKRQLGENHFRFSGYYITPWGKFTTSKEASTKFIKFQMIIKWCKNSDKIITNRMITPSKYLTSLKEFPLGKTLKEIGFDFIPKDYS